MRCLAFFIVFAGLLPVAIQAQHAEPDMPVFRVEVLLFAHANGVSDRRVVDELDDFSGLIDPLRRARELAAEAAWLERQQALEAALADPDDPRQALELLAALDALVDDDEDDDGSEDEPGGPQPPDSFLQLDELSPAMADAWRRLSTSAQFQTLGWRAWYQPLSRQRLSPLVRLHDDQAIRLQWSQPELLLPGLPFAPLAADFDLNAFAPLADYRLDGSFRLRQRQFMHVELDLVWREELEPVFGPVDGDLLQPGGFAVHRMNQSRTVRTDRLEYFDSALFGVLVLIQRWQADEAESDPQG